VFRKPSPIEPHAFGAQPEFLGQLDEARHRQAVSLDQVAAANGADFGIDPVLRAEAKETSKRGLAGDDLPGRSRQQANVSGEFGLKRTDAFSVLPDRLYPPIPTPYVG
jgi:hypothetical protein